MRQRIAFLIAVSWNCSGVITSRLRMEWRRMVVVLVAHDASLAGGGSGEGSRL
jgi:hypothetical protein